MSVLLAVFEMSTNLRTGSDGFHTRLHRVCAGFVTRVSRAARFGETGATAGPAKELRLAVDHQVEHEGGCGVPVVRHQYLPACRAVAGPAGGELPGSSARALELRGHLAATDREREARDAIGAEVWVGDVRVGDALTVRHRSVRVHLGERHRL